MSNIEWTDETWNCATGCDRVSPGCAHCYALTLAGRLKAMGSPRYQKDGDPQTSGPGFGVTLHHDKLTEPLRWRKPRRVFVNSMSDLFHELVPDAFIDRVFAVMALCGGERQRCRGANCKHDDNSRGCWHHGEGRDEPIHTFQILTKRPERMKAYIDSRSEWRGGIAEALNDPEWSVHYEMADEIAETAGWPLANVWLGVSVENQHWADERIPLLLQTPAAVRFISAEPLLGPIDLQGPVGGTFTDEYPATGLHWVIVGGESGTKYRPMNIEWARSLVEQCSAAGVACFVKQLGGQRPGTKLEDLPVDLRVREYPA